MEQITDQHLMFILPTKMKHRVYIIIVAVVLACAFLVSCEGVDNKQPLPIDITDETPVDEVPSSNTDTKETSLSIIKTAGTLFDNSISSSEGLYKIRSDYGGSSILYYDYETMALNYLSNQLIATSSDENPGWIPSNEGGTVPVINNDYLYVVTVGLRPLGEMEGTPPKVFRMAMDGSDRKELILSENMLLDQNSGIAGDDNGIYLLMDTYDAQAKAFGDYILLYIDGKMEKTEEIAKFSNNVYSINLYGAFGNELVFRIAEPQEGYEDASRSEQFKHLKYKFICYDIVTHEETLLLQYNKGELSISYDFGNIMYYCYVGENEIHCIDITSREDVIALHAEDIIDLSGNETVRVYDPILDGKIGVNTSVEEPYESHKYYYDLSTGDLYEPKMVFYEDDVEHPVMIVAETEDSFVVLNGYIYYTEIDTIDGMPAETTRIEKYFSLITKEDYWNNNPNYESFTDYVYPADAEIKTKYAHSAHGSGY